MNDITYTFTWQSMNTQQLQKILLKRFYGHGPDIGSAVISVIAALGFLALTEPLPSSLGLKLFGVIVFGFAGFYLNGMYHNRKLAKAMRSAPVRTTPSTVNLNSGGISAPGALIAGTLTWPMVIDLVETEAALLILFSPIEYIPVPYAALPDGVTPGSLKAQVEEWRG